MSGVDWSQIMWAVVNNNNLCEVLISIELLGVVKRLIQMFLPKSKEIQFGILLSSWTNVGILNASFGNLARFS